MRKQGIHIGFDAKRYFQNKTGLGNYSHHIIDGLASLFPDLKISLFSPRNEQSAHTLVAPRVSNFMAKFWRISGMVHEKSFKQLDIYHGLSNELPWRRTKVKTVVTIHDIIFKHLPNTQHPINRWIYDFKTYRSCKIADKIIATSEYTKKDLVKFYKVNPDKIDVVYQDCHPQFYDFDPNNDIRNKYKIPNPYILCVGTIESRKQQLLLLKAFSNLDFAGDLVLVGKKTKDFIPILAELHKSEDLLKRVHILENVAFEDLPALYGNALLFAYPSVCEGFGIPILEAMNIGTAVITTQSTVMEEVGADAVAYYQKYTQHSLEKNIQLLIDNPARRQELIQKGKERALLFRKEKNLPQLLEIYTNLCL